MSANGKIQAMPTFHELSEFPNGKVQLLKALMTSGKTPQPDTETVRLSARVRNVLLDPDWMCEYNAVCGFKGHGVSLTAPQVIASPLHLFLLSRPEHPMPMLGMVHLHNSIESVMPLEYGVPYDVLVTVGETRAIAQGLEFDVYTDYLVDNEVHWRSMMSILCRIKDMKNGMKPAAKPALPEPLSATQAQYTAVKVSADTGRQYAKVSNDYNPIHLYAPTARMFGFRQAIAHGMWTAAKSLSIIEADLEAPARKYDLSFRQPVFLPSNITLKRISTGVDSRFEVLAERDSKILMLGNVSTF